jgi:hypothetical protein
MTHPTIKAGKRKQRPIGIIAFFDKDAVLDAVQDD